MSQLDARSQLMSVLESLYRATKGVARTLHGADHLIDDLSIDSLASVEILVSLEERYGLPLLDDPRYSRVATVGELVDLLLEDLDSAKRNESIGSS